MSSAAVVIGALRVNNIYMYFMIFRPEKGVYSQVGEKKLPPGEKSISFKKVILLELVSWLFWLVGCLTAFLDSISASLEPSPRDRR